MNVFGRSVCLEKRRARYRARRGVKRSEMKRKKGEQKNEWHRTKKNDAHYFFFSVSLFFFVYKSFPFPRLFVLLKAKKKQNDSRKTINTISVSSPGEQGRFYYDHERMRREMNSVFFSTDTRPDRSSINNHSLLFLSLILFLS